MKLVLDENLPPAIARALAALSVGSDHSVLHVRDLVPRATPDVDWIPIAAAQGVDAVVSLDHRMLTRKQELASLRAWRLTVFILAAGWSGMKIWDKAWLLTRWWPRLVETAEAAPPGSVFRVPAQHTPKELRPNP